jgi:DNA (cytosine-5)-methyltransferase 1
MLTVGSLFSGIGGLELGLERAGMQVRWQCEFNRYARCVLDMHWPDVTCYRDVRTLAMGNSPIDHLQVDVLCGGFPCQDISCAGKMEGLSGKRSGLWFEFARIIGRLRPKYVIVENVRQLVRDGLQRVLSDLAGLRYDAEWQVVSAAAFGAKHLRKRLFLVAYPSRDNERAFAESVPTETLRREGDLSGSRRYNRDLAGDIPAIFPKTRSNVKLSIESYLSFSSIVFDRYTREDFLPNGRLAWKAEPRMDRMVNGLSDCLDRLRCLGNAVVPQVAQWIGESIIRRERYLHDEI